MAVSMPIRATLRRISTCLCALILPATFLAGCSAKESAQAPMHSLPTAQAALTSASAVANPGPARKPYPRSVTLTASTAQTERTTAQENQLPGSSQWQVTRQANDTEMSGFLTPMAAPAGTIRILRTTTTSPTYFVTVYRVGWYQGLGAREVVRTQRLPGYQQPSCGFNTKLKTVNCANWVTNARIDTKGWQPGVYLAKLVTTDGAQTLAPFVVRSKAFVGRQIVVPATATWQAYNRFGGYSLYKGPDLKRPSRSRMVSFHRPFAAESQGAFMNYDLGLIRWIESQGKNLAYLDSYGLEASQQATRGATSLLSLGHDEYWSLPMRKTVDMLMAQGTNIAFLGANAMWWRVRWDRNGGYMYGYKDAPEDPIKGPTTTTNFIVNPGADPENRTTGSIYLCSDPARAWQMRISQPKSRLFRGIPAHVLANLKGLVTGEMDTLVLNATTPKGIQLLAHSPVQCDKRNAFADMTVFRAPSGAAVFNAGTFGVAWSFSPEMTEKRGISLESQEFSRQLVTNIVSDFAQPRAGTRL